MAAAEFIEERRERDTLVLAVRGRWLVAEGAALQARLAKLRIGGVKQVTFDLDGIDAIDTTGAWLLLQLKEDYAAKGAKVAIENIHDEYDPLFRQLEKQPIKSLPPKPVQPRFILLLNYLGSRTVTLLRGARGLVGFLGLVTVNVLEIFRHRSKIRIVPLVVQMERTGVSALGIVGLLSFLIGVVMAFQGADQLRQFGAQIYTVNLLGVSFLRELGALLAAIIVAGRSGSAFTAEIGAMVVNEEVDAIRALGLNPIEVLVVPRVLALVICLPLLTFYANMMGLLGGAIMCRFQLGIPFPLYLSQLQGAVSLWSFWLGILKAPFFAVCIALIGCNEGLSVSRSAESVGRRTTLAVVQSIFLVIVFDAAFSILFSYLHI
ncbi:MAG TPA: MlaE family lipid ABC transporter permease subunit [Stellaceae bacterium]|jgi:phospholipid/cholesterol/gamma-HCH transport system permease protein|nr:MlaE family lipid ABC transporter permease subunit [Stellaceae bacterium]